MKITKRQLRRIIKEEKAKLLREMSEYDTGAAEFSSVAMKMGFRNHFKLSRLYEKIETCDMRMVAPEKCANLLRPQEKALFLDDFMNVLVECQHPQCKQILDYSYEVESYI